MKKILLILAVILTTISAQAQIETHQDQTKYGGLKTNDIVTIARDGNSYFMVNDHKELITHNETNINSLWRIVYCAYQRFDWGDQNIYQFQHLSTGLYLYIEATGTGNNSRLYYRLIENNNPSTICQNNPGTGSNAAGAEYEQGRMHYYHDNTDYFMVIQNNAWGFQSGNVSSNMRVEKWTESSVTSFDSYFSPETYDFGLVKYQERDADENVTNVNENDDVVQTKTLRFVANKRTSTIYSRNGRQQIEQTFSNVGDDENYMEKITGLSFKWQSSKGDVSTLTLEDKRGYTSTTETTERPMMQITNNEGTLSADRLAYEVPIQALGKSPLNLRHEHNAGVVTWSNYVDYLIATWTDGEQTYSDSARVVRKSYHTIDLPAFEYSTSPSTFTFEGNGGSQTFKINGIHQHGTAYYDVDGRIADKDYEYGPVPMPIQEDEGKLKYEFTFEDLNGNTIEWLSHNYYNDIKTNNPDTTITITATANNADNATYRQGRLHGVVTLNRTKDDKEHEHIEHIYIPINQRVEGGQNINFSHREGKGDTQFDNNNRQQVHTAERTIYYTSGQREIKLQLAESNFFGYMRWYDYDSNGDGGDPTWNADENKRTTWATAPRGANGTNFKAINTSYGNSRGLYGINNDPLTQNSENNPAPVLRGWNYTSYEEFLEDDEITKEDSTAYGYHTIACDVSAYTDYNIQTAAGNNNRVTSITEPTLSYRQLFHLRPAEEMAKQLNDKSYYTTPEYLENYKYRAAVGADVHLATKYRYKAYSGSHESELCYFYYNKKNELKRIGKDVQAKWFIVNKDGTETPINNPEYQVYDYLNIDSDKAETVVYVLKVPKNDTGNSADTRLEYDLLIARFEVKFVNINECGPRTNAIITDHEINEHFIPLKKIDFNFGYSAPNTDAVTQLDHHLPWDQSTYGYFYPKTYTNNGTYIGATNSNHNDQDIPYYGEYFLVNKIDKVWARAEQHGGAANGYALYVDGTTEPGVVVSISTDAVICAGQTLYCSAWLCNPCPESFTHNSPRNPIFRCNVEGRIKDIDGNYGEWEDISIFFVGQLPKQSGWQQIVFPVESEKSYDETRVSIYNFATGGSGNDFMVDDITLFASGLPLAAYQAQTNCASQANTESSTAAILRIDYTEFQGHRDQYMYYQIYNNTADKAVELKEAWAADQSAYYHDNTADEGTTKYGSITIPRFDYTPQKGDLTFNTIQDFKDYLVDKTKATDESRTSHEKAYIQSFVDGQSRWLLYVMHIIPNVAKDAENINENTHLREDHNYSLRMANVAEELDAPECNMQTPLQATQATHFDLYSIEDLVEPVKKDFLPEADNVCANDLYVLKAEIKNLYAPTIGGTLQEAFGEVMGDWLVGYPFDDVYTNTTQHDQQEAIQTARESFKNTYGYYREEVTTAILYDLRRQDESNTNLLKTSFEELDANAFEHPHHYTIIKDLYEAGLLELGKTKTSFYLGSEDIARYWFFPIDGTAKATVKDNNEQDVTITLHDCSEPIWVRVSAAHSEYTANLAPITKQEKTTLQKLQLPTVRVLHSQIKGGTITIPVTEISRGSKDMIFNGLADKELTLNFDALNNDFHFIDIETGEKINKPESWEIGKEYTMRLRMKIKTGNAEHDNMIGGGSSCRVGTIYFHLLILPDAVIWTPAEGSYNGWGLDENWRGWNDDSDGIIEDGEVITTGFVPIAGSNVVIRTWGDPTLCPYIHDHNHYPLDVNAHPSKCKNIYFEPGAHIHNQHLLEYENAFVDMQITAGAWNMVSAPLQNMVSGDMYIPHEGNWQNGSKQESSNVFNVSAFQGARHTDAAYVFWQGFYNTTVNMHYEGKTDIKQVSSANFVYSNTLSHPLTVGSGYQLYGLGLEQKESLTIRLPKPDQQYEYYDSKGQQSGKYATFDTTNRNKLAFTPNNNGVMDITLTNKVEAGSSFLFGNPTMAYIDMKAFLETNNDVLNPVFHRVENNSWRSATELTLQSDRYLAPMTSVMLETKDQNASQTITVHLKPEHLTLNNHIYTIEEQSEEPASIAPRVQIPDKSSTSEIMTISTSTNNAYARTILATNSEANDYYQIGEDALFISTGIESESYVTIPLNMYTVAEQVPMMADVRQGISEIPLAILAAEGYHSQYMQVAFYLTSNWSRTCYFCDSKTGQKIRIMDGLLISVEMPLNHEQRYYIEGPDTYQGSDGVTTSTTQPSVSTTGNKVWAYAPDRSTVVVSSSDLIKSATLFDLTGRMVTTTSNTLITNNLTLHTNGTPGVYIVDVTLRDGTTEQTQVIVQ